MNEFEQTLLLSTTALILATTLAIYVWQWFKRRGRDDE